MPLMNGWMYWVATTSKCLSRFDFIQLMLAAVAGQSGSASADGSSEQTFTDFGLARQLREACPSTLHTLITPLRSADTMQLENGVSTAASAQIAS